MNKWLIAFIVWVVLVVISYCIHNAVDKESKWNPDYLDLGLSLGITLIVVLATFFSRKIIQIFTPPSQI